MSAEPFIDTNILIYAFSDDPERSEFRSVLAGEMRRGLMTCERACALQAEALLEGAEFDVDSQHAVALAPS